MVPLDFDLLCRGGIGFIQHPMSLDFDQMGNWAPFKRRKLMLAVKSDKQLHKYI